MFNTDKIKDTETHFKIDPLTRTISNSSAGNNTIVQYDHNSERFTFDMPRYVDGHDMSDGTLVRIHYRNATTNNLDQTNGVYIPDDLVISSEDKNTITFSWLLTNATTQNIGYLYFSIQFIHLDGDTVEYAWNTGIYKNITVIESINNAEEVIMESSDLIAALKNEILAEVSSGTGGGTGGVNTTKLEARIKTLEEQMDKLTYVPIEITSFTVSPSVAEIGSRVDNPTLSWKLNKAAHAVMLDGVDLTTITSGTSGSRTTSETYDENKTWTLKVEDEEQNVAQRSVTLSFLNGVYWGVMYPGGEVNASIKALEHKELRSSHKSSFTVTAGENAHIAYCVPKRFGTRKFRIGGFEGGFESPLSVSFTNATGYTEDYYIYLSTYANLGTTTVEVING